MKDQISGALTTVIHGGQAEMAAQMAKSHNPIKEEAAKDSGFFLCRTCGLLWFGHYNSEQCPEGPHGKPVQVALLCRECDSFVPLDNLAEHLACQTPEALKITAALGLREFPFGKSRKKIRSESVVQTACPVGRIYATLHKPQKLLVEVVPLKVKASVPIQPEQIQVGRS